ncbi:MAG: hypothetical protein RMM31_11010 [Anaerolineae bacterium]|nr:hypothetical protein [Anaerolineae bacterium]
MVTDDLGFTFWPPIHEDAPGYPRLDITLFAAPTHRHFDPRQIQIYVDFMGSVRTLDVRHPWHNAAHHLCPGRIRLVDFADKTAEMFSLGGQLTVESFDTRTRCVVVSNAPILRWIEQEVPSTALACAFESLLARRRAAWLGRLSEFEARLTQLDPLALYKACLRSLCERLDLHATSYRDGRGVLRRAIRGALRALEASGDGLATAPPLEQIL